MAGGNSHQRAIAKAARTRIENRVVVATEKAIQNGSPASIPETIKNVPKPPLVARPKGQSIQLTLGDSITLFGLLLGVIFVIIVPPLIVKVILLAGVCVGFFVFFNRSHWTHKWKPRRQLASSSLVVSLLLVVAIPQFVRQWKDEHHKPAQAKTPPQPAPIPPFTKTTPIIPLTHEQFCLVISTLEATWIAAHVDAPPEVKQKKKWTLEEFDWLNLKLGEQGISSMSLHQNEGPPLMTAKNQSSIDIGDAIFNGDIGTLATADSNSNISAHGNVTVNRGQRNSFVTPPCP